MRLLTSFILLSLTVIAASCSKSHYAQVEPDDLYFTHKDRKEAVGATVLPGAAAITSVEPSQTPTEYERNEYSERHSPVFATPSYGSPTIQSSTLGSPTIQQNEPQPYYDSSVNPDYLYEEDYADLEGASSEYYNEEYAYTGPPVYETPQVNNYYYGIPPVYSPAATNMMGINVFTSYHRPFGQPLCYWGDPFYGSWSGYNYFAWNRPYHSYGWYDPFDPYFGSYISYNRFYNFGNSYYGYGNYYGNTYYHDNGNTYYSDGTKVVTKPRQSRSQVSYEVDKTNLPIQTRRADYVPGSSEESGRVATTSRSSRTGGEGTVRTSYTRRSSSPTYRNNGAQNSTTVNRRNPSGTTVRDNGRTSPQRNRTVVVPTKTRTSYTNRSTSGQQRNARTYNANRSSVNRSGSATRSGGTTRYSTRTTNANRSGYGTRSSSGSGSRTSYRSGSSPSRSSSGTRSGYSSGGSSSRSYSAPSRSSGSSGRSVSPSRSSSSRSSGTRSSSSSSGRSSGRRN